MQLHHTVGEWLFFCLVLNNHKIRCQLQAQGRVVLNTSDLDVIMSAKELYAVLKDAVNHGGVATVKKKIKDSTLTLQISLVRALFGLVLVNNLELSAFIKHICHILSLQYFIRVT